VLDDLLIADLRLKATTAREAMPRWRREHGSFSRGTLDACVANQSSTRDPPDLVLLDAGEMVDDAGPLRGRRRCLFGCCERAFERAVEDGLVLVRGYFSSV